MLSGAESVEHLHLRAPREKENNSSNSLVAASCVIVTVTMSIVLLTADRTR